MTADGPSVIRCLMCLAPLFDSVVGCLASSAPNAAKVRQAVQAPSQEAEQPNLVLPGYAKGGVMSCPLDTYPEIHRVTAVVSLASVFGGSPLAHDTSADQLKLLRNFPGAKCEPLDGGAVHDILPEPRKAWLAQHTVCP